MHKEHESERSAGSEPEECIEGGGIVPLRMSGRDRIQHHAVKDDLGWGEDKSTSLPCPILAIWGLRTGSEQKRRNSCLPLRNEILVAKPKRLNR